MAQEISPFLDVPFTKWLTFNVTSPKIPSELVDSVELKCSAGQVLQPFNPFQVQSLDPKWCPKALGRKKSSHPLTPIIPIPCLFLPILIIPSESSVTSPRTSATREEAGKGELLEASVPKLLELHWCGVNCPTSHGIYWGGSGSGKIYHIH